MRRIRGRDLLLSTLTVPLIAGAQASEIRLDLTVCADPSLRSFRVIEVAYESLSRVPCFTYLSSEERGRGEPAVTEQIAWARTTEGLCERSASQIQRQLELQGYQCLVHREDEETVTARVVVNTLPTILITSVTREAAEEDLEEDLPENFNDDLAENTVADSQGQYRTPGAARPLHFGLPQYHSDLQMEDSGH